MDIRHYEAIGNMKEALSRHAEEAYAEVGSGQKVADTRVFKALTDRVSDPRGIRRPCSGRRTRCHRRGYRKPTSFASSKCSGARGGRS